MVMNFMGQFGYNPYGGDPNWLSKINEIANSYIPPAYSPLPPVTGPSQLANWKPGVDPSDNPQQTTTGLMQGFMGDRETAADNREYSYNGNRPYGDLNNPLNRGLAALDVRIQQNPGRFLAGPLVSMMGMPGVGTMIGYRDSTPRTSPRIVRTLEALAANERERAGNPDIGRAIASRKAGSEPTYAERAFSARRQLERERAGKDRAVSKGGPGRSPNRGDVSNAGR